MWIYANLRKSLKFGYLYKISTSITGEKYQT